jgi:hypothetical protein
MLAVIPSLYLGQALLACSLFNDAAYYTASPTFYIHLTVAALITVVDC